MITVRKAADRGAASIGWLDSRHSFSFGSYYNPAHMGFGSLRVINDDRVQPSEGFGEHGHRDMEILSYVVAGALEHRDSMGNGSVIRPGDVQRMSAGTGIRHSEYNHSDSDVVHFLQIWIVPERTGLRPGYEQKHYADEEKRGRLLLVASGDGRDGSLTIHQDADMYASVVDAGMQLVHELAPGRKAWIQVVSGSVEVDGTRLDAGDGAAIEDLDRLGFAASGECEFLLFDLA
ncbi:MAG: pirin family protein [Gammaproteobacteria bacterium]|nr:pirin family protein [Gammaproteobacteria bacterium]MDH5309627.1 pirin family protein [Gammaproteobacteria bacterium]